MSDDDNLDALFGALGDEDEEEAEVEPPKAKKTKFDEQTSNGDDAADNAAATDNAQSEQATTMTTATSNSTYAQVMSRKIVSHDHTPPTIDTHVVTAPPPTRDAVKDPSKREVATGTAVDKTVRSYSAYPKNIPPGQTPTATPISDAPAKTYPFELDPFQQQAIGYVHRNESVLVSAHTSAGKTAVAEYAIAQALQAEQRCVYTSPIKALSNQKFRDLQDEFGSDSVGLMTGDITVNPVAPCLVMTTEILRNMLYRGSEIMKQVAWVIYDEVHYMRDVERGVVWEESIILLPHAVKFVFLSATIPNASQFADWIAHIHHQPCHVVYTNFRPVPLQHYILPQGGDGLHLIVDERGKFREANFQKAMAGLSTGMSSNVESAAAEAMLESGNGKNNNARKKDKNNKGKAGSRSHDLFRCVNLIVQRNLTPVIIFSFSKKECERYALALQSEDYTDDVEKDLIHQVYVNAIEALSDDDRTLPQVEALLPLLKRGIGIHHGGLLPILKEIVEILFSEGLVKILFATETFAIGINMPAKTVVFTSTRKWDGRDFRWLSSGEYIQMSGRAGRRGKDDRGIVIQIIDEKMEPEVCKDIVYGTSDPLNSSYRISYHMLLNLMRVEDVDPYYLIRASFHQYQREAETPGLLLEAESLENQAEAVTVGSNEEETELAAEYYRMDQQLLITRRKITTFVQKPEYALKFLQAAGRFLNITIDGESFGWGALVSCKKKQGTGAGGQAGRLAALSSAPGYTLEVLVCCVDRHFDKKDQNDKVRQEDIDNAQIIWRGSTKDCRPVREDDPHKLKSMRVFTTILGAITSISAVRIFLPQDLTPPEARQQVFASVQEVLARFPDGVPLLDPVSDMGIKEEAFMRYLDQAKTLADHMAVHRLSTAMQESERQRLVGQYETKITLLEGAKALRDEARDRQTMSKKDELKKMKRVLKRLGHVDGNGVIQTKGRAACEVNTSDELVVIELIFSGVFNNLSVEQSVSLLCCLTFDESNSSNDADAASGMDAILANPFYKLQDVARTVVRVEIACGLEVNEDEFVFKFNPKMMPAVYAWCRGQKFVEVQKLAPSFEGTTIRTLRRLEELVRQMAVATKAIGNHELCAKFEKGGELLRRDIVFCASLYL